MCGRTSLAVDPSVLSRRFDAAVPTDLDLRPRYNIAPGDDLVVVRNDDRETLSALEWGLIPSWVEDPADAPTPINARSETAAEKPTFREAFERRRCLVLADGFYEWAGTRGHKQPYRIERPDRDPFAFAGLWETWRPPSGATRATCTILTCPANGVVGAVHDRMPVILERRHESTWLDDGPTATHQAVLTAYPDAELRAYPVSRRVNDPTNDSPDLLDPVDVGSQTDLGEFGG